LGWQILVDGGFGCGFTDHEGSLGEQLGVGVGSAGEAADPERLGCSVDVGVPGEVAGTPCATGSTDVPGKR